MLFSGRFFLNSKGDAGARVNRAVANIFLLKSPGALPYSAAIRVEGIVERIRSFAISPADHTAEQMPIFIRDQTQAGAEPYLVRVSTVTLPHWRRDDIAFRFYQTRPVRGCRHDLLPAKAARLFSHARCCHEIWRNRSPMECVRISCSQLAHGGAGSFRKPW
jgi:hypothetical protein